MIILDLHNAVYSRLVREFSREPVTEELVRHIILYVIQKHNGRFRNEWGKLVIAADGRDYWRRTMFPYYKHGRKKVRDKSPIDWKKVMSILSMIRDEIATEFSYPVVYDDNAEADDVIATIVQANPSEPIMILSGDHDFKQLHASASNLKQWDINHHRFVTTDEPLLYLKEHIIRGDGGDGIPNILSPDNVFAIGIRQRPIRKEKLDVWMPLPAEQFCTPEMLRNFQRNKALIDLTQIPPSIQEKILDTYKSQLSKPSKRPFNYLFKHGMSKMMENVSQF